MSGTAAPVPAPTGAPVALARWSRAVAGHNVVAVRADPDAHAALLHRWMNAPHVAEWWSLAVPLASMRTYLAGQRALAHSEPWIVKVDAVPLAYVETYRPAEDPLAEHASFAPTDRGWHIAVGPSEALGDGRPRVVARAVLAHLFSDPAVGRIVCEPDERNARMLAFCAALGHEEVARLDLPDKRAALLAVTRARFGARFRRDLRTS